MGLDVCHRNFRLVKKLLFIVISPVGLLHA
jgi:hypothetical protein